MHKLSKCAGFILHNYERHRRFLEKRDPQWTGGPILIYKIKRDPFENLLSDLYIARIIAVIGKEDRDYPTFEAFTGKITGNGP